MPSDSELLRRYLRDSSQEAFAELVRRHINFVYAAALRQAGSAARAEDVTQAVFTDLAKKATQLVTRNDLVGWLHTSTHYAAASIRRSEARRAARELKAHMIEALAATPEENANWQELRPVLDEALRSLGERDREAILLRYFKQQSSDEIGLTLGLSEEAVRKRIERGVTKLRTRLSKRGITSTIVALEIAMTGQAAVAAPAGLAAAIATHAFVAVGAVPAFSYLLQLVSVLKTITVGSTVVAVFIAGGFAIHSRRNAHHAENELSATKVRYETALEERDRLEKRLAEVRRERAQQQQTLTELKTKVADKIHKLFPLISSNELVEALLKVFDDGEFEKLVGEMAGYIQSSQHFDGPLFQLLKLTPAQIDQFLAIERGNAPFVPSCQFVDKGNGHGSLRFALNYDCSVDLNAMRQFLGDAGYREYEAYDKMSSIRTFVVNNLASNLVYTQTPLNASVAQQLTLILANSSSDPEHPFPAQIGWESALKQAKEILTPTQLSALARLSGNLSSKWTWTHEP